MLERAEYFVIYRAHRFGKAFDIIRRFEYDGFVAGGAFKLVSDIHHAHIHTYPAHRGKFPPVYPHDLFAGIQA